MVQGGLKLNSNKQQKTNKKFVQKKNKASLVDLHRRNKKKDNVTPQGQHLNKMNTLIEGTIAAKAGTEDHAAFSLIKVNEKIQAAVNSGQKLRMRQGKRGHK